MRQLSDRERRTIRIAAIGIGAYLVIFAVVKTVGWLEGQRASRVALKRELAAVRLEGLKERRKQVRLEVLRRRWGLDLPRTAEPTVVGDARVAIEKAARACGTGLRIAAESPGRRRAHELAVFQVSGGGNDSGFVKLIHRMCHLGYPVAIDNVEVKAGRQPGTVTFSFSIALVDYATWSAGEEA
jgi:hypothetical protein